MLELKVKGSSGQGDQMTRLAPYLLMSGHPEVGRV
jgi:hypothetical protein